MSLLWAVLEFSFLLHNSQSNALFFAQAVVERMSQEVVLQQVKGDLQRTANEMLPELESLLDEEIKSDRGAIDTSELAPLEIEIHVEYWIMPDGRARCRFVWDYFGEDAEEVVQPLISELKDGDGSNKDSSLLAEKFEDERHDNHVRLIVTHFFTNFDNAPAHVSGEFRYRKTSDGFTLTVPELFSDMPAGAWTKCSQTFIMPGPVLVSPPGSTTKNRTINWRFDSADLSLGENGDARSGLRKIQCGPSLIGELEFAQFSKELDDLVAEQAKASK